MCVQSSLGKLSCQLPDIQLNIYEIETFAIRSLYNRIKRHRPHGCVGDADTMSNTGLLEPVRIAFL